MSRDAPRKKLSLQVNGRRVTAEIPPARLLVDFLRRDLGLTGTHQGCDTALCGACTVLLDGAAVKSCNMLALEAEGADLRTIEGMAGPDGALGAIQAAFHAHHALQCGFCTPGMVMAAADLLARNPMPSEAEIRAHLGGNLCRCTGYQNIVRAIRAAAEALAG